MDNLQLRQRITRSMIRVNERTANMRKPEKFEYRRHMTGAFMEMLELCIEANRARGQRRAELQNKKGQRYPLVSVCRWRPPETASKPRRLAVVCDSRQKDSQDPMVWQLWRND